MTNRLELVEIYKSYGKNVALDRLSMDFEDGIYGLLGHNGAGKTTLLNIISGIIDYDGRVLFNGEDIKTLKEEFKDVLGYVPQQQNLDLPLSLEHFLYYISGLKGVDEKGLVENILKDLDLYEHRKKSLSHISGGMKQRLLIAQALLNNPKILLLDEPTAGLDPVQRRNLRDILAKISKDKIVFIATHVISDIELIADEIIFLKNGFVVNRDKQDNLLSKIKVYESFEDIEMLKKNDDSIKQVNIMRVGPDYKTRFISKKDYPNRVSPNMDDVYLEWLG
ncbi:ABC transporter ATP-binding protein [Helcococcus kunzii]|uniref:ABC transporter ATP-binding protein n=1 Tax=Helcococcus kunzii TaxID=40091 RepID=UPI0024AD6517|nr:ATP-binding cassette domain-containing protein [Helcococcus kunzii]